MRITAALTYAPDAPFELREVELDEPRDDEILVRMVAAGICHTDLGVKASWPADAGPLVLGHEGAGVVEEVGAAVAGIEPGDHVLLSYRSCRECASCRAGHVSYCERFRELNAVGARPDGSTTMRRDGTAVHGSFFGQSSFATHALAYASNTVKVDAGLDLLLAAPLGCGVQTGAGAVLHVLEPAAGSSFVVFGAGGVGLAGLMAAAHLEVATAIAVDPVPGRRELALELGATHALDPRDGDVVAAIHELTGGGAGSAFDTTGIPAVIADAARALGRRGALALVGTGEALATLDVKDLIRSGKSVRGVMEGDADPLRFVPQLIELVQQGRLPIERMIAGYPFAEINRAVADASSGAAIKPVLAF
ncbi:MAG: aryl-alcohol dehydrogenase [Solirubrobacteraceae bacterium]|jgi:aryl-alcohol dehydrogenase|nr:aryl-alcohol dehydrogenase [Solirubrobacteraceae bacterium]